MEVPNKTTKTLIRVAYYQSIYLSIYLSIRIYCSIVFLLHPGRFFSFLILYTGGRISCTRDQPIPRPLPTHKATQTQNKRIQIHALSGIRTHGSSVRASEDISCLRLRGRFGLLRVAYATVKQNECYGLIVCRR
jgi:hypothetical protein